MKVALAQINPTIGDVAGNTHKIQQEIASAVSAGASLVVFPELAITGYPPQDLLDSPALVWQNRNALDAIAATTKKINVVIGFIDKNPAATGRPFFNAAALLRNGKVEGVYHKQLLPTYDVFDDERYFESGQKALTFDLEGARFGVTICEDIWNLPGYLPRSYTKRPLEAARTAGVQWLINLSASPFHLGKPAMREKLLHDAALFSKAGMLFCNQVGANDDLVFDGSSCALDSAGNVLVRSPSFQETMTVVDLALRTEVAVPIQTDSEWLQSALVLGIRDYVRKSGGRGVCLGLSGGIDSSVVAVLAVQAVGAENVSALMLPSRFTSDASKQDATALAATLGIQTHTLPIDALFKETQHVFEVAGVSLAPLTLENIQPRLRMSLLMAYSNEKHLLLLNTSNKSELAAGYATLYGDSAGAVGVLGDLTKNQVFALARHFNRDSEVIPARVIDRAPSAELRENQKDEDSLPPYSVLDPMVKAVVEEGADEAALRAQGVLAEHSQNFLRRYRQSEFKRRQFPPILRVSPRAFGRGRRIPLAAAKPW